MLDGRLSLGRRLALLLVPGLALVIFLFGFLGLRSLQTSSDQALRERLIAAQLSARHIDRFLDYQLDSLGQRAERSAALTGSADRSPDAQQRPDGQGTNAGIFDRGVFLVDSTGRVQWGDPRPPGPQLLSSLSGFIQGVAGGQRGVSGAIQNDGGAPLVALGVPVLGAEGKPVGAMVGLLELSQSVLNGFVEPMPLGATSYSEIVDQQGIVLAGSDPSQLFQKSDHTTQFAAMIQTGQPTVGSCHSCHDTTGTAPQRRRDVLAFAPLSVAPWGVAIRQSEDEVLGPTREFQRFLILVSAVSMAVAILVVFLITRSVVNPVRRLTYAARRIAGGDLEGTVESAGPAEIRELAGAFDDMRSGLRLSLGKLEAVRSGLEIRVEQRTRQLSVLLELSNVLASTFDVRQLLDAVATRTSDVLELADGGLVALWDEHWGSLEVQVSWGYGDAMRRLSILPGEGACGKAFVDREAVLLETPEQVQETIASMSIENRALIAQAREGAPPATSIMALPLVLKGNAIGAMMLKHHGDSRPFSPTDLMIAEALADQISVAVEHARLYQELAEKERLRGELLNKVITAQEEERRRIARELHDDTCQSLAALAISLESVEYGIPEAAAPTRASLADLKAQVRTMLQDVRTLALNLRPSVLDDLGLIMAIDWYAKDQMSRRGLEVKVDLEPLDRSLPLAMETVLFRITQEALNNVAKHSGTRNASVRLRAGDSRVILEIEDDGLGFDVERTMGRGGPKNGLGLHGMKERAALSGGELQVLSYPGKGTIVRAELPINGNQDGWTAL